MLFPFLLISLPLAFASDIHSLHHSRDHSHHVNKRLPGTWYHARDHPVHDLFKRADDGVDYASVGSPTWASAYPTSTADTNQLPQAWVDALNTAVAAGRIPDIPIASALPDQSPTYPDGHDPNGPEICSATYKCRNLNDTWDAPDGYFGVSFDDGPQPASEQLMDFLKTNDETVTHFMIGVNILYYPDLFQTALDNGDDIAVHTWTHPYMTTRTNLELLGEFGWSMQIIHNSTGGRLPKYWRPPYGDADNRVRAIAREVFGLHTIIWNQDTEDWSLTTGGTTAEIVNSSMTTWLTGPKSPGLVVLEHELSDQSVASFIAAYPLVKSNGWTMQSLVTLIDPQGAVYQNVASDGSVTPVNILAGEDTGVSSSATSASSSSSSVSSKSTASATASTKGKSSSTTATSTSTSTSSTSTTSAQSTIANGATSLLKGLATSHWALLAAAAAIAVV